MTEVMRQRIIERLSALGISATAAAERDPELNRFYIYDFVQGKKASIPEKRQAKVAEVLETTVDWLNGRSNDHLSEELRPRTLPLFGTLERGAWREAQPNVGADLDVHSDPRYPYEMQRAFLVRGDSFEHLDILDGSIVIAVEGIKPRQGDIAVTKNEFQNKVEFALKRYEESPADPNEESFGVALRNIRVF
ncbi:LexA family transcriptional regulator [Marivivens aquimaris]|uniref:hypothetical protein n=1 Tax=Marivivens aquimaris TaxID=2774876 RepID=UPI0018829CD2|nr:hypothetical protein [Marivivens aquimaris]